MGQLALGFRSLLVKLAVFFLLASLLAWTLGGTLWPRAEIVDLAPVSYGQKAWFLRLEVGGKHRGRALWRLMTLGPDGEPQPADERQWDDVAGPVLTRDGLFIGLCRAIRPRSGGASSRSPDLTLRGCTTCLIAWRSSSSSRGCCMVCPSRAGRRSSGSVPGCSIRRRRSPMNERVPLIMTPGKKNVEFKAELRNVEAARRQCALIGAHLIGTLRQTDQYYRLANGRLKRRSAPGEPVEWIRYERPDRVDAKTSHYEILSESQARRRWGQESLQEWVRVVKTRELWLMEGVRIHLDEVDGLGSFIEFETLVSPEFELGACYTAVGELRELFAPLLGEPIAVSYCDLVLQLRAP